jgi:outer membrane protein assembly factor BamB
LSARKLGPIAALSVLACAAGCEGLQSGASPELPLWVHHPGGAMEIVLRRKVTVAERVTGEDYEHGRPEIDVRGHRVFVGSSDRGLYALKADDGHPIWRFETLGPVQTEPLYEPGEDALYFGSNDGALYKVAALDGTLRWRFMTNAEIGRRPVLQNGMLYVVNANDTIVAMEAATGKLRWSQHRSPALGMEISGYAGPLVTPDRVYVAFSDGHVAAYDPLDGTERWPPVDLSAEAEQAQGEVPRYLDVDTTPVLDRISIGPVIYVGSYAGGVFALDAQTGSRVWVNDRAAGVTNLVLWQEPPHAPRDGVGPTVAGRKLLLASSGTTGLWALGTEDGREIWRRPMPDGGVSAPVAVAGALMVSTTRYGLFLFSPYNGGLIDGIDLSNGLTMAPAVYGRRAFVMSNTGVLLGIHVNPPRGI